MQLVYGGVEGGEDAEVTAIGQQPQGGAEEEEEEEEEFLVKKSDIAALQLARAATLTLTLT
jgi:hypothetical protein